MDSEGSVGPLYPEGSPGATVAELDRWSTEVESPFRPPHELLKGTPVAVSPESDSEAAYVEEYDSGRESPVEAEAAAFETDDEVGLESADVFSEDFTTPSPRADGEAELSAGPALEEFDADEASRQLTLEDERWGTADFEQEQSVSAAVVADEAQLDGAAVMPDEEFADETGPLRLSANSWIIPSDVRATGESTLVRYDPAPLWDGTGRSCSGRLADGARQLREHLLATFRGIRTIGGYNCRRNSATSERMSVHGTGRALDIMITPVQGSANSSVGDPVANFLVLNARAIGVQYLIWNRVQWSGRRSRFNIYGGPNPHIDHIHVELNGDGAAGRTPWFAGRGGAAPRPGVAPASPPAAELVRFAQQILNGTESERLTVDGIMGPLTRGALERFRARYELGAGSALDRATQLALVQRGLEELAQQSMFRKGAASPATDERVSAFKASRGLPSDAIVDAATRRALGDAVAAVSTGRAAASGGGPVASSASPQAPPGRGVNSGVVANVERYRALIDAAAQRYGVDAALVAGVIAAESGGRPDLVARSGYTGLMQAGKGEAHKQPATSIDAGTRKLRDFRTTMERVLQQRGRRYDQLPDTEQIRLLALAYNAGPVTVAKALEYATGAGSPERWLDAEHYKRSLLFTGAYSINQAAPSCLRQAPAGEHDGRKREAARVRNHWRLGTKSTPWRQLPDPPPWSSVSPTLPPLLVCAIDFKHRNAPHYVNRILAYRQHFRGT